MNSNAIAIHSHADEWNLSPIVERQLVHSFSIVLPVYNPRADWVHVFLKNQQALEASLPSNLSLKYIIVNDGSIIDDLENSLAALSATTDNVAYVSYQQNRGKGYALREGIRNSDSDYYLLLDIDFPYFMSDIANVMNALIRGHDLVIGKRGPAYYEQLNLQRKVISKSLVLLNRLFFKLPVYDTQAGLKGFNQEGKKYFLQTTIDRFLADTEFIIRADKAKLSIKTIALNLKPGIVFSNFGSAVIKTEFKNFLKLLKLNRALQQHQKS